jgi:hypothetical protein
MHKLDRLATLSALLRQAAIAAAGAARTRVATLRDDLAAPALTTPPEDADPATAAQHARWSAARRRVLAQDLAVAEDALARRTAAARRAIGTDDAIARIGDRLAEEDRRRARRGPA